MPITILIVHVFYCFFSTRVCARNTHWTKYSYLYGASSDPLKPYTISGLFDDVVQQIPDREFLVSCHENKRYTFAAMDSEVGKNNNNNHNNTKYNNSFRFQWKRFRPHTCTIHIIIWVWHEKCQHATHWKCIPKTCVLIHNTWKYTFYVCIMYTFVYYFFYRWISCAKVLALLALRTAIE